LTLSNTSPFLRARKIIMLHVTPSVPLL